MLRHEPLNGCLYPKKSLTFPNGSNGLLRRFCQSYKEYAISEPLESLLHKPFQGEWTISRLTLHHLLNVFGDHIGFEIHWIAGLKGSKIGHFPSVRNDRNRHFCPFRARDRQTDTLDTERALVDDIASQICRNADVQPVVICTRDSIERDEFAGSVNMPLHDMSAEASIGPHGQFEVDERSFMHARERCPLPRLIGEIEGNRRWSDVHRRQTDATHCNRIPF